MLGQNTELPQVGSKAPFFQVHTRRGVVRFPEYAQGHWCVFFAHPANFTAAWAMFSAFLAMKERWLHERNTKVLGLSNETIGHNDWSDKARRFVGIYLKAPVIEDLDFSIARLYGLASGRRPQPGCDRLGVIVDPEGIVRLIITRPLPNIESDLMELQVRFDQLLNSETDTIDAADALKTMTDIPELADAPQGALYQTKPAYFQQKKVNPN